jgi:hypothetical protein
VDLIAVAQQCQDSLPDCAVPLLQRLVREATREFCKKTWIWRYAIPQTTLANGVFDYDLTANQPAQSVIWDLANVQIGGMPILPYSSLATVPPFDQAPSRPWFSGVPFPAPGCGPRGYLPDVTYNRDNVTTITVAANGYAMAGLILTAQVVVIPSYQAQCIPDVVYDEWFEAIEQYVKWKAMARVGEKFSDPVMAAFHEQQWLGYIGEAKDKARGGNMKKVWRTVPNDFG